MDGRNLAPLANGLAQYTPITYRVFHLYLDLPTGSNWYRMARWLVHAQYDYHDTILYDSPI